MTRKAAGALRLRGTRIPARRARRLAVAAILLTLAGAAGDCASQAREPGAFGAAEAGR